LESEILLIDEVLAVGDAEFQKKCLGKMDDVAKQGRTVIFVSHNMGAIENLCDFGFLINKGSIVDEGHISEVLNKYLISDCNKTLPYRLTDSLESMSLYFTNKNIDLVETNQFRTGDSILFFIEIRTNIKFKNASFGIGITDNIGQRVVTFHTTYQYNHEIKFNDKLILDGVWNECILLPGKYNFTCALYENNKNIVSWEKFGELHIVESDYFKTGKLPDPNYQGKVVSKFDWLKK